MVDEFLFAKYYKKLCYAFNERKLEQGVYDVYYEALSKYTNDEITYAINGLIANFSPTHYKPFPVVADIIELIKEKQETDWQKQQEDKRRRDLDVQPMTDAQKREFHEEIQKLIRKMSISKGLNREDDI